MINGVDGVFFMKFDDHEEATSVWRSAIQSGGLEVLEPSTKYTRKATGPRSTYLDPFKAEPRTSVQSSSSSSSSPDTSPSPPARLTTKARHVKFEPDSTPQLRTPSQPSRSSERHSVPIKSPSQPRDHQSSSPPSSSQGKSSSQSKGKGKSKSKSKGKGYVVFVGRNPGVYDSLFV